MTDTVERGEGPDAGSVEAPHTEIHQPTKTSTESSALASQDTKRTPSAEVDEFLDDLTALGVPIAHAEVGDGAKEFYRPTGWQDSTVDGNAAARAAHTRSRTAAVDSPASSANVPARDACISTRRSTRSSSGPDSLLR